MSNDFPTWLPADTGQTFSFPSYGPLTPRSVTSPYTTTPSWTMSPAPVAWNPPPGFTRSTIEDIVRAVLKEELTKLGLVPAKHVTEPVTEPVTERKTLTLPMREFVVKFPGGYVKSVRASSEPTALLEAYGQLRAAGHNLDGLSPSDGKIVTP